MNKGINLRLIGLCLLAFVWVGRSGGCKSCNTRHVYKPVIYLYPPTQSVVKVKVKYKGDLTVTYPEYKDGWEVEAYPDGRLVDKKDNKEYSYLFWEGKDSSATPVRNVYNKGFVVKGDSAHFFLQEKLALMGMEPKEYNEFIVFWYPILKQNPYNFIYFNVGEEYDEISTMEIDPQPDAILRVFMNYQPMNQYIDVQPQKFTPFDRKGFTVVEWGGGLFKQKVKIIETELTN